ncbi:MAG: hypothetical protein IJW63_11150 [Lachnospiraceae bacterium]|nr:hypothetical protein [Lachnospiraceae bacterium]
MKKKLLAFSLLFTMLGSLLCEVPVYATTGGTLATNGTEQSEAGYGFYNPKVLVTSYEITEGIVAKDEEFTIKVELTNMNSHADAYNVVTTFTSYSNNVYITEGNSNVTYFEQIKAGESVSFTMELGVMDVSLSDSVSLGFTSVYSNDEGVEYGIESIVTPLIEEKAEMEVPAVSVATKAVVGAKALVSVRYSNVGDNRIENVVMKVEGNIEESQKTVKLDELNVGEQKYLDYYVTFAQEGEQKLTISFEYQDSNGNNYTIDAKEYTVDVYSYTNVDDEAGVINTERFTIGSKEIYMLIAASVLVGAALIVAVVTLVRKRSKDAKKKEQK